GATDFSGPLESWVSGLLYDNVTIDGSGLHLENRWRAGGGVGWSAANCTIWQSNAAEMRCFSPPGALNRAVGTWGRPAGDGAFEQSDEFVKPRSLFAEQLATRLAGEDKTAHLGPMGRDYVGATNPTPAEAEQFARQSERPAPTLRDLIASAPNREMLGESVVPADARINPEPKESPQPGATRLMTIVNGRLLTGGRPLVGRRFTPIWWRGNIRPSEAPGFGPAITRFVPGRIGRGFTDDLNKVADELSDRGIAVIEHHHGLWYDRRRDDHTRVRRPDGNVVPPFYEQPFARSSSGRAWDGLSRYDLTMFNPWYWHRLKEFADLCDHKGAVLFAQHYFQHNLLEAGAHWTDFPWREANNVNTTAFPEPPPYAGDKRIFQAHLFYDPANDFRRPIHRRYIRKHLDTFADNRNVIHSVGAEFTGPLGFVQFWIDTILEWERETGKDATVCLSCTKDVQDAILADPARCGAISVIDIRYWW
ncbi:MAG: pectate lyase, partial [Akkermansiaceae bacterium]|nr:pectate lyase [Akkermansiaceae bacterium]